MSQTIYGRVEGGVFSNVRHLMDTLRQFDGQGITVKIAKKQLKWTDNQRKYLFGAIYPFVSEIAGVSVEEAREGLKNLFLSKTDGRLKFTVSESDLDLDTYEWYLKQIDAWCIESYGLNIPEPR